MMPRFEKIILYPLKKLCPLICLLVVGMVAAAGWNFYNENYVREVRAVEVRATEVRATKVRATKVKHVKADPASDDMINIMLWHRQYSADKTLHWYRSLGTGAFKSCPEPRCRLVNDSDTSHAILISHNYLDHYKITGFHLPPRDSLDQKWIFYSRQAPQYSAINPAFWHLFNATFTHMSHSNTVRPYGNMVELDYPAKVSYADSLWGKKKDVVSSESHCNTPGGRDLYAAKLAKYIDVAMYGTCGSHTCTKKNCGKYFQKRYKFFLAFENSVCREYATQKVFSAMMTRMIPVVYGLYDYKKNLPPNSFIDVRDFETPKKLAKYLKVVSGNKTLFDSYFKWKETFRIEQDRLIPPTCELCEYLHNTRHDPPVTVHLDEFWDKEKLCVDKETFLESLGVDVK